MKPILFNTEMVRAILDGRKTVTRRVVMPQPKAALFPMPDSMCWPGCFANAEEPMVYRPPYKSGDILYVRETWAEMPYGFVYRVDGEEPDGWDCDDRWRPSIHMPKEAARIFLRVTDVRVERLQEISYTELLAEGVIPLGHLPGGCKCSAYTDGCMDGPCVNRDNYEFWRYATPFIKLWDRTVKPADRDTSGWDADPWVWVIEFERISKDKALGGGMDD